MKNQLLFFAILAFTINATAQITDMQWLIVDKKGKTGTSGSFNSYPDANVIGSAFTLTNVAMPNIANSTHAFNDLFIIYENGSHYNSRYHMVSDDFFRAAPIFSTTTDHSFITTSASPINYMYLTNGYEKDDLPPILMVKNGSVSASPITVGTNTTSALTANHDAVLTKDITLVVNMDSVRYHLHSTAPARLYFDAVEPIASPSVPILGLDIYDPSFVFNDEANPEYPVGAMTVDPALEFVTLNDVPGTYRYLNLRANENALIYPPDADGNPQYNALFRITDGSKTLELREPIRYSHDPNFLRVDSICKQEDGAYHIFYHLEFENESDVEATSLVAKIKFPDFCDTSCLGDSLFATAGTERNGEMAFEGDSCVFTFNIGPGEGIIESGADPKLAIGYINFRVKVFTHHIVPIVTNSIRLNTPVVYMDGVKTEITDFRDLINAKGNPHRPLVRWSCLFCEDITGPTIRWWWIVVSGLAFGSGGFVLWLRNRAIKK